MPRFNRQKYYCFFNDADTNEDGFLSRKELEGCLMDNGFKGSVSDINVSVITPVREVMRWFDSLS